MVISQALREFAETELGRIWITSSGELSEFDGLPEDTLIPALVVGHVTEAVKQIETGTITQYLNRDALWAVQGFVLDRQVISSLPDGVDSAADLVEAVTRAGYEWQTVVLSPL